jgi:putative peptidoglycan lipid II flippase
VLFNIQFGAGSEASAFYAAIRLPDALFSLIAGGALSSAMIPVLLTTSREDGREAAGRLVNLVLNSLLAVFALAVVVGEVFTPPFVTHVLAPGFDAGTSATTVSLTRLMLVQPLILAVGSVATAVLNGRNQFFLTAVSVASHNIGLIGGIVASRVDPALGIYGPTLGGFRYRPVLDLRDRRLRQLTTLLIPNGLAVGVAYTGFIVDTAFASQARQAAALPAVHNAFMLVGLPIALLGQAVGQSAFPRLAAAAASERWSEMLRTLLRSLAAVVALAVPAVVGLIVLGRLAIRILFEHGRFGEAAGSLTYQVLAVYAVALPAYVAAEVLIRGLIALRDTRTPLVTNTVQVAGRAAIMSWLISTQGVIAIPIAFASMATAEAVVLGVLLGIRMRRRVEQEAR